MSETFSNKQRIRFGDLVDYVGNGGELTADGFHEQAAEGRVRFGAIRGAFADVLEKCVTMNDKVAVFENDPDLCGFFGMTFDAAVADAKDAMDSAASLNEAIDALYARCEDGDATWSDGLAVLTAHGDDGVLDGQKQDVRTTADQISKMAEHVASEAQDKLGIMGNIEWQDVFQAENPLDFLGGLCVNSATLLSDLSNAATTQIQDGCTNGRYKSSVEDMLAAANGVRDSYEAFAAALD